MRRTPYTLKRGEPVHGRHVVNAMLRANRWPHLAIIPELAGWLGMHTNELVASLLTPMIAELELRYHQDAATKPPADPESVDRRYRAYRRRVWGEVAMRQGINPVDLHALAAEYLAVDRQAVAGLQAMLLAARRMAAALGYAMPSVRSIERDSDAVRGMDDVAERMAERFPEAFAGHADPQQRLFDLLTAGRPPVLTEDESYRRALAELGFKTQRRAAA